MTETAGAFLNPVMNALAVFESVAITGTVSAAARNAGMSQSGLSRHIKNLETFLGVSLFRRINRKMVLTREGEQLFRAVHDGLENIRSVALDLQSQAASNRVTVSCGHGTAHFWLLDKFPELQSSLPHLDLTLTVSPIGLLQTNPESDLVIRAGRPAGDKFHVDLLFPEHTIVACSPTFLERHNLSVDDLTPERLLEMPLLHMDRGEYGILWFGDWFRHFGLDFEPDPRTLYYNSYPLTVQAAIEGKGFALVSRYMEGGALRNGRLIEVPKSMIETESGQFLICRKHDLIDDDIRAVRNWLCRQSEAVVRAAA